jgi:hypothetical protein
MSQQHSSRCLRGLVVGGPARPVVLLHEAHDDAGDVVGAAPLGGLRDEPLGGLLRVQDRLHHGHGFLQPRKAQHQGRLA